jgi:hypothetical protein
MKASRSWGLTALLVLSSGPARADVGRCLEAAESAQRVRGAGELRRARDELIVCSAASCPAAVRGDCTRWLAEVEALLPTVVVQVRDDAAVDLLDVTVTIDGVAQQGALGGRQIVLDPGPRLFRFAAPGRDPVERTVVVREGQKGALVTVVLPRPPSPGKARVSPLPREPQRNSVPAGAWVLGGVGAALLGTGATFWALGSAERTNLRDECASAASCTQTDINAAKTKLVVGDVVAGVGILAVAAGLWFALRTPSVPRDPGRVLGRPAWNTF